MKNIIPLIFAAMILLGGCSQNPLLPPGEMSFYSGKPSSSVSSVSESKYSISAGALMGNGYIYVKRIEISMTGEEWINILEGPVEVKVNNNELVRFGTPVNIPNGQYHAVRIVIEPKIHILGVVQQHYGRGGNGAYDVDIVLNQDALNWTNASLHGETTYLFSSSIMGSQGDFKQSLVPFDVERDKGTSLVFNFGVGLNDPYDGYGNVVSDWEWKLGIGLTATRYLF